MANTRNNKRKILALKEILERETNESHSLTIADLVEKLEAAGFPAEKKSVTRDLHELEDAGMDIERTRDRAPGYYLADRTFELPELKMLADAVAASRFITEKKSRTLLSKIGTLTNRYDALQLHRQVTVSDRVKAEREAGFYGIDTIFSCIDHNHQMSFHYSDWELIGSRKELVARHGGALYRVSPCELLWDSERYYLIAYAEREAAIRFYRVDKITDALELDQARDRQGMAAWNQMDPSTYTKRTFSMFAGQEEWVTLRANARLTGVLIDRFGTDLAMRQLEDGRVQARALVEVSPQFFGWLTGLGPEIEIAGPEEVREEYRSYMEGILDQYLGQV